MVGGSWVGKTSFMSTLRYPTFESTDHFSGGKRFAVVRSDTTMKPFEILRGSVPVQVSGS